MNAIKSFFKIEERGSTIKTELLAGLTTFLAMAYILPVNASMLADAGMPFGGVFLATALAAIIGTLIMGLYAKFPVALAPGMGVNAVFTWTIVSQSGYGATWEQALGAVLISGIIFFIISITGLRKVIINAIPRGLKFAIGAGIGFFIAFIGLQGSGIVVSNPDTLVKLGNLGLPHVILTLCGLLLGFGLYIRGNKFSLIIAMTATAIAGFVLGLILGDNYVDRMVDGNLVAGLPTWGSNTSGLGDIKIIFGKAFTDLGFVFTMAGIMSVFTLLFIDFFDTAGTLVAVGSEAGLMNEEGELIDADKALMADSAATVAGAVCGVSTTTAFVESTTGIEQGGRTGLTAVTVAVMFALALIAYPLISIFNASVTSIALIMVGGMMIGQLKFIDWDDKVIAVSSFVTILMMVLTFSIAEGIAFGFIIYSAISLMSFRKIGNEKGQLSPVVLGTSLFFIIYYIVHFSL